MLHSVYRYQFQDQVPLIEVEASLLLSIWACEALHGESQVRLEASHVLDEDQRTVLIDADSAVGRDLNRLFIGFLRREFPPTDFSVQRVEHIPQPASA